MTLVHDSLGSQHISNPPAPLLLPLVDLLYLAQLFPYSFSVTLHFQLLNTSPQRQHVLIVRVTNKIQTHPHMH